jgi:hypothetical protein
MSDVIVHMRHVRQVRGCSRGARAFCERHGIDWAAFLKHGVPASTLKATGDAMAIRLAETAEREAERE